jgi:hypothetical protein
MTADDARRVEELEREVRGLRAELGQIAEAAGTFPSMEAILRRLRELHADELPDPHDHDGTPGQPGDFRVPAGEHFHDCARCGHAAWAHGDQSGTPSPQDPCHAAVVDVPETRAGDPVVFQLTGDECDCSGYINPDRIEQLRDPRQAPASGWDAPPSGAILAQLHVNRAPDPGDIVDAEIVCNHAEPFLDEQMVDACACGAILREGVVYRPEATS